MKATDADVQALRFEGLYTGARWLEPAWVIVDADGNVVRIQATADPSLPETRYAGYAVPGLVNGHSHAFQYAMAGLAEHVPVEAAHDDFWSWRDTMYALAGRVSPDEMQAIATTLYRQLLRRGFTHIVEFHYVHHDKGGAPYSDPGEMGGRLVEAARVSGIRLTLAPVLYKQGGFGQPPKPAQARFIAPSVDAYMRIIEATRKHTARLPGAICGLGVHSLRAATVDDIRAVNAALGPTEPFHIHAAEVQREVDDCVATLGARPVRWLLDELGIDRRHSLVHCTHMDEAEITGLARSGATAVVCPSTEGNLGDGFFAARAFLAAQGSMSVGTDSHIGLSAAEELRWLDYGQRMRDQRRNVLCAPGADSAETLWNAAYHGGRAAAGLPAAAPWTPGEPFDAVLLDPQHPVLEGKPAPRRMAAFVHGAGSDAIMGVLRAGLRVELSRGARE